MSHTNFGKAIRITARLAGVCSAFAAAFLLVRFGHLVL